MLGNLTPSFVTNAGAEKKARFVMIIKFFAIQNQKGQWYNERSIWQNEIRFALIYTNDECAKQRIRRLVQDYPSQACPKLIEFECQKMKDIEFKLKIEKANRAGSCKFCKAPGFKSNQGGIGVPEWEVYAAHKKDCPVREKGHIQGELTWIPLNDWNSFYSKTKVSK